MIHRPADRRAHGSALLLVMILLGVLAAIGAAAMTLASRDRINASAKTRRDQMVACAQAAQAKVWAELAVYGPNWLSSSGNVTEFTLTDGTRLGPLHYDQATAIVKDAIVTLSSSCGSDNAAQDLTNTMTPRGSKCPTYRALARCTIPAGNLGGPDRQLEVEFVIRTRL